MLPKKRVSRKVVDHTPPFWVPNEATFFLTINCQVRGKPQLTTNNVATLLIDTWLFYREKYHCAPLLILVMPDHLHMLISFSWKPKEGMPALIKSWKRYTSKKTGIRWQRGYFDHRIRNQEDFDQKWDYIINNPIHAKLTDSSDNWQYRWINPDAGQSEHQ